MIEDFLKNIDIKKVVRWYNLAKRITQRKDATPFTPQIFNSSVALKTSWSPLARSGASFKTHHFTFSSDKAFTVPTKMYLLFLCAFTGITIGGGPAILQHQIELANTQNIVICSTAILLFTIASIYLIIDAFSSRTFDLINQRYYKGIFPSRPGPFAPKIIPFSSIAAIQLLSEKISTKKKVFKSYEFNLVLQDGKRVNIVDHVDEFSIIEDATEMANLLNIPLWNAIDITPSNILSEITSSDIF